jgi:hypothetical protein
MDIQVNLKWCRALRHLASTDKDRLPLNHISIERGKTSTKYVATDGRVIGIINDEKSGGESGKALFHPDWLSYCPKESEVRLSVGDRYHLAGMSAIVTFGKPDFTFPDWRRVIPRGEPCQIANLNLALLLKFDTVARALKAKSASVRMIGSGAGEAQCVIIQSIPSFRGFIMPVLDSAYQTIPTWLREE